MVSWGLAEIAGPERSGHNTLANRGQIWLFEGRFVSVWSDPMTSIKTVFAAAAVFATTSVPAMAQSWWWWWGGSGSGSTGGGATTPAAVPEIDGSTAVLAVAAILAALAFAWERNRRRA